MRVLIIDDHEVVRRGLRSLFHEMLPHAEIAESDTAEAALATLESQAFDLALLDINLAGRSGMEVLQALQDRWPSTRVLVLSMYPEKEYALRSLKLGAAGYLTKQSASDELRAAVSKALAGGRYISAAVAEQLADHLGRDTGLPPHQSLSNRELEVLRLVAAGRSGKEIAASLGLSEKTIGTYRARIAQKTGLSSANEITRYALQQRLLD